MDCTQKRKSGFCLENATMFQIQNMFENGKPNIVLNLYGNKIDNIHLQISYVQKNILYNLYTENYNLHLQVI